MVVLGIDLGTGNSCVGYTSKGQEPKMVLVGESAIVPSIVNGISTYKRYLGVHYEAVRHQNVFRDGDNVLLENSEGKRYSPFELTKEMAKYLLEKTKEYLGDVEIEGCVVTVPAHFTNTQRQLTKQAVEENNIKVFSTVNEPTAAALASVNTSACALVIDIGSGTTDVTLLDCTENVYTVLNTAGNNFLGGEDIIQMLYDELRLQYYKKHTKPFNEKKFRKEVVRCFHALSYASRVKFLYESDFDFSYDISRPFFDNLITPILKKIRLVISTALQNEGNVSNEIQELEIVLTGGVSRVPAIQNMIETEFGEISKLKCDPDLSIAYGATVRASQFLTDSKVAVQEVTSVSIGVEKYDEMFDFILPRNTPIPCKREIEYTTPSTLVDKYVDIKVYEGERRVAKYNHLISVHRLDLTQRRDRKRIYVTFSVDESGIVNLVASEKNNRIETEVVYNESLKRDFFSDNELYYEYDNAMASYIEEKVRLFTKCKNFLVNMRANQVLSIRDIAREEQELFDLVYSTYEELLLLENFEKVQNEAEDLSDENIESIREDAETFQKINEEIEQKSRSFKRKLGEYKGIDGKFSTVLDLSDESDSDEFFE